MKLDFIGPINEEVSSEICRNSPAPRFYQKLGYVGFLAFVLAVFFPSTVHGQLIVDCSLANPYAYPTISAALLNVTGPGAVILVSGTCTEDVALNSVSNLNMGAWFGQQATVHGSISVNASQSVYLYGLNVSSATGDGITINGSREVTLDSCTSNGNLSWGLNVSGFSEATVVGPASFDNNGTGGITLGGSSYLNISDWAGLTEISNNKGPGIFMSQGNIFTLGATTIANNTLNPGLSSAFLGFGLVMWGASTAQFGTCFGPNLIGGNQSGGIFIAENSEISLWPCGSPNLIQGNGPVGISVGFGSQVTLAGDVQITGHTGPGVDLFGNSQLNVMGDQNLISQNGTVGDPRSAAIRVDGNSEVFLRGGQISQNLGPGILALVNSSADFTGVTFTGNSGGVISCDSSAFMVSDLSAGSPGVLCRTPHNLGNRHFVPIPHRIPDWTLQKNRQAQYKKLATLKH